MKNSAIFYLPILILALSACGPSQADLSTQTAVAETSIAASWTAVAASWTATPTLIPTLTPTPTKTPLPTATPIGGGQGQIIFLSGDYETRKWEIYSINSNGTGRKQLTFLNGTITHPVWSPAGDKIAFALKKYKDDFFQLYIMNSDGSGITKISTNNQKNYSKPDWSPDGKKIVFDSEPDEEKAKQEYPPRDIFVVNSDGSNEIQLTNEPGLGDDWIDDYAPDWSPDGTKIAFASNKSGRPGIYVMNSDGTNQKPLTSFNSDDPKWSPDGKYIVFNSLKDQSHWEIYLMKSDGTDIVRLTNNADWDLRPKFSPDGTKISWDTCCFNISTMNLDGSDVVKLYSEFGWDFDWKP